MHELAVFGWDDSLGQLLATLEQRVPLRAIAVGDPSATQLVRARSATGLPCYQHLLEMARVTPYDAALISTAALAPQLADQAAKRGADLLLAGDCMDAEALEAAATAAVRHGVALAVLRPALQSAGYAFLTGLIAAESGWQPRFASLELCGNRPASSLLRDAVAAATRLLFDAPSEVAASAAGPEEDADALVAHLRFPGDALVSVTTRTTPAESLRISTTAAAGTISIESDLLETRLTVTPRRGDPETSCLSHGDFDDLEATRVASIHRRESSDTLTAQREAATLSAFERSLESGRVRAVSAPTARAAMRVLRGGREPATPRAGQLQIVTS